MGIVACSWKAKRRKDKDCVIAKWYFLVENQNFFQDHSSSESFVGEVYEAFIQSRTENWTEANPRKSSTGSALSFKLDQKFENYNSINK